MTCWSAALVLTRMKGGAGSDMIYADAMDTVINGYGVENDEDTGVDESVEATRMRWMSTPCPTPW